MTAELVFAPETERDIVEAYDWYERQRPGLGEDFLSCLDAAFHAISRSPEICATVHEDYRRALVRRFPYGVFYRYEESVVTVYCILHTARDPAKWRQRLG